MFEDMFKGQEAPSAIDVLNNLLDPKNIEMKSDLNMTQIRILCKVRWYALIRDPKNQGRTATELLDELMQYAMQLMVSLKRMSRKEATDVLKDLNQKLMEEMSMLGKRGVQ